MRNRVERLRVWLLGSAGFLLLVIVAFVGSAHFLARRRMALPARLGVNIVRETNGFSYSQTVQGKTVFTIHAAKAVEHTDGKIALHDVSILLYGEKQERNDRISGDEFEYDQKAGVVRATGAGALRPAGGGGCGGGWREGCESRCHCGEDAACDHQRTGVSEGPRRGRDQ